MVIPRFSFVVCAVLVFSLTSFGDPPLGAKNPAAPDGDDLPVGRWRVEFSNGVVETVEVEKNGAVSVVEPKRTSPGKVTVKNMVFVMVFDDDRVERWTPVGQKMVVEHWCPGSEYPAGSAVRGIAARSPIVVSK